MYRAVHLSVPNVIAQFKTVYRDSDGMMIDSRTYNVDLNTGTTIDWDVSLQVSMSIFCVRKSFFLPTTNFQFQKLKKDEL